MMANLGSTRPPFARRGWLAARVVCVVLFCANAALHAHPGSGIVLDKDGSIYFVDTGQGVWRIDRNGRLSAVGGPAFHWMTIDHDGGFTRGAGRAASATGFAIAGAARQLILSSDVPVAMSRDGIGVLYYPRLTTAGRVEIVGVDAAEKRHARAVLAAMTSRGAPLQWINGLAAGSDGAIYYTEDEAIGKIDARGMLSVVVPRIDRARIAPCSTPPGSRAESGVQLRGLDVATDGALYVAATGCGATIRVSPDGVITTVLRATSPWAPTGVAVGADGIVYVLEYLHTDSDDRREWIPRVRKIAGNGAVTTLATVKR